MAFLDYSSPIGALISMMNAMTGSLLFSMIFLITIILFLFIGLRLPIELSLILIIPLVMGVMLVAGDMNTLLGIIIFIICIIIAKNWFSGG